MTRVSKNIVRRPNVKRASVVAACNLMLRSETLIFDVRDAESYARQHIPSARRVSDANMYEVLTTHPKDRPVLIYCYHGNASQTVALTFIDFGFREVYSMDGGFEGWRQAVAAAGNARSTGDAHGS